MRVTSLHVYPLKSARGLSLERVSLDARGVEHDRAFMFVDRNANFITQREQHRMALIRTSFDGDSVVVDAPNCASLRVPLRATGNEPTLNVRVWDDLVDASLVSEKASEWASAFFRAPTHLVRMPESTHRQVDTRYAEEGRNVGFADGFPLLVATEASLAALNATLTDSVTMEHFRPNIVIDGEIPFEEDAWQTLRVGSVTLRLVKPCARCVIVNIDPETAIARPEPLQALAAIRTVKNRVLFGQNAIHDKPGEIAVGDLVQAT